LSQFFTDKYLYFMATNLVQCFISYKKFFWINLHTINGERSCKVFCPIGGLKPPVTETSLMFRFKLLCLGSSDRLKTVIDAAVW